jgi:K+/H+ antiporter YhaU regulatory subunit KhtT
MLKVIKMDYYASFDKYTEPLKQCMNKIELILAENIKIYQRDNGSTEEYKAMREVRDAVSKVKENVPSNFDVIAPHKTMSGLESILSEVEQLEKQIPDLTGYDTARIRDTKEYIQMLGRAIKEPENAKEYISDFKNNQVEK